VTPDIFRLLLNYIYGGTHAKEIIDAADKYGVVNLKLEAEACFVEGTTFTIENVMEHLFYAESENCALLKEVTMDFIVLIKACSRSFDHRRFSSHVKGREECSRK
jgi:hypothetical protein